jgi:hypothetical protein
MTKNTSGTSGGKDFPKPDAQQAAHGQPAFEAAHQTQQRDKAHGYTQDSGYATSGGPPAETSTASGNAQEARPTDEQIRQRVHERLTQQSFIADASLTVSVADGIVTLAGEVPTEIERGEITELVRTIPAVRHVRSEQLKLAARQRS